MAGRENAQVSRFFGSDSVRVAAIGLFLSAGVMSLACANELSVGANDRIPCLQAACSPRFLSLGAPDAATPAQASTALVAAWSKSVAKSSIIQAFDGGLWVVRAQDAAVVLQHVDEQGVFGPETAIAGPTPLPNTTLRTTIGSVSPHPRGPVVTVVWNDRPMPDSDCAGHPAPGSSPGLTCRTSLETLVFDVANLGAPARFDPCSGLPQATCNPSVVLRSGDGLSLLVLDFDFLEERSATGVLSRRIEIPWYFRSLSGVFVAADKAVMFGNTSGQPMDVRGLISLARGGDADVLQVGDADVGGANVGGIVLPGVTPGEVIAVLLRSPLNRPMGDAPGDLSILRLSNDVLQSQQVIERQGYSNLELMAATVDAAGSVYVATSTGDRDAFLSQMQTPLLCKLPSAQAGACFSLPLLPRQLQATRAGSVFALSSDGTQLSRFDVP